MRAVCFRLGSPKADVNISNISLAIVNGRVVFSRRRGSSCASALPLTRLCTYDFFRSSVGIIFLLAVILFRICSSQWSYKISFSFPSKTGGSGTTRSSCSPQWMWSLTAWLAVAWLGHLEEAGGVAEHFD